MGHKNVYHSDIHRNLIYTIDTFNTFLGRNKYIKKSLSDAIKNGDKDKINEYVEKLSKNRENLNRYSEEIRILRFQMHQAQKRFYPFEQRMYVLVDNYLKTIEVGVQAAHAMIEYSNNAFAYDDDYNRWAFTDKTIVELNVGNHPDMVKAINFLDNHYIKYATFNEPDHGNYLTATAFLLDERVWDRTKYPDYKDFVDSIHNIEILNPTKEQWAEKVFNMPVAGAERIMEIREFIFSKRLAQ